ncbi:MAG: outer membrane lipoprotein-sorting protein [Fidelibacterota bacterium]
MTFLSGQSRSGDDILRALDHNAVAGNRSATITLVIHGRRTTRTVTAKSLIQGNTKSFTEYIAPPREKGTKMLKVNDQLWVYSPQSDRVIRIAGHMLRQSLMGSDLSYEDMLEDQRLTDMYQVEILGSEGFQGRDCWRLRLTARTEAVAYYQRLLIVDKLRHIALREERFARSGTLLKTTTVKEVMLVDGRWYPRRILYKDALSKGKGTEIIIEDIAFDVDIPEGTFSKASLRN